MTDVPYGYCHCGCGRQTVIADRNDHRGSYRRGEPRLYVVGHQRCSGVEYVEEDRGYTTPCWVWQRALNEHGYGVCRRDGRMVRAHRWFYEQANGPLPQGLQPDHLCRVRACVNPDHLEPVTVRVNNRRGKKTKLTWEDVCAIRKSAEDSAVLAARYGVGRRHVLAIRREERWRLP